MRRSEESIPKVKMVMDIEPEDKKKLREIAAFDCRDMSHEVIFLIKQRWEEMVSEFEDFKKS